MIVAVTLSGCSIACPIVELASARRRNTLNISFFSSRLSGKIATSSDSVSESQSGINTIGRAIMEP